MSRGLMHVLHRIGRLKQRFETERQAAGNNPIRLLKLRSVILKAERRLQHLAAARLQPTPRLQPVMARTLSFASRR